MSCHLWNINKKFVSILEIKINELEGQVPKDTFKSYLDILIAIKNNKNIIKKNILGESLKQSLTGSTQYNLHLSRETWTWSGLLLFVVVIFGPGDLFVLRISKHWN